MKILRYLVVASLIAFCPIAFAGSSGDCLPAHRISDGEAVKIAKGELTKRSPQFDASAFSFSVKEDGCDLRVYIDDKRARSVLVLSRAGKVKQYWGPM
jgi:hypothetical protein